MNFIDIDPLNMDTKQKRIYDEGFAILDCGANGDCLYKVMALHMKDDPAKFLDCRKNLVN